LVTFGGPLAKSSLRVGRKLECDGHGGSRLGSFGSCYPLASRATLR
jgi:hypothetical protein